MDRVNRIWNHPEYVKAYETLQQLEKDRVFCGHSAEHFLDVARLMWIYNLQDQSDLDREVLYAAAFLHDIGRGAQYSLGIPHHEASVTLGKEILPDCGYSAEETEQILSAILDHRDKSLVQEKSLRGYLCRADLKSRNCMCCQAAGDCNWAIEKRNLEFEF